VARRQHRPHAEPDRRAASSLAYSSVALVPGVIPLAGGQIGVGFLPGGTINIVAANWTTDSVSTNTSSVGRGVGEPGGVQERQSGPAGHMGPGLGRGGEVADPVVRGQRVPDLRGLGSWRLR